MHVSSLKGGKEMKRRQIPSAFVAFAAACFLSGAQSLAESAYVTNAGSNNVSVIDTKAETVVAIIPVGVSPGGSEVVPNGI
jgi:YVTN family beta-propeller protein